MKGYFHNLIKQTGITFKSSNGLKEASFETFSIGSKGLKEIIPIHSEEGRLIENKLNDENKRTNTNKTSPYSVQHIRNEITQHSADDLNDKVSEEHRGNQVAEMVYKSNSDYKMSSVNEFEKVDIKQPIEEKGSKRFIQEEKRSNSYDNKLQSSSEDLQAHNEINKVELSLGKEIIESDITPKEHTEQSDEYADSVSKEFERSTSVKLGKRTAKNTSLKELRKWNAETSFEESEGIEEGDTVVLKDRENETYERKMPEHYYPKMHQGEEQQIHDLQFSIGTISLIIEEPHEKTQVSLSEQEKRKDEVSTKENNFSRLNRHYIRI